MPKIIELSGVVGWEISAGDLKRKLAGAGDVILKVDSPGGSVFEGNRLYNIIKDHVTKNPGSIQVELGALAASAASYFPLAVGRENVKVHSNTTFMAHKSWTFSYGNADQLFLEYQILSGLDRLIARAYAEYTGQDVDELLTRMAEEIWLIGGEEIVEAGFASGIVDGDAAEGDAEIEKTENIARIESVKDLLKKTQAKEDLSKWAAQLHVTSEGLPQIPKNSNIENKIPAKSLEVTQEATLGKKTDIEDTVEQAKNTIDQAVIDAQIADAVAAERKRFSAVLELGGIAALECAASGMTAEEFAVAELTRQKEARKTAASPDMGALSTENQVPDARNSTGADDQTKKFDEMMAAGK